MPCESNYHLNGVVLNDNYRRAVLGSNCVSVLRPLLEADLHPSLYRRVLSFLTEDTRFETLSDLVAIPPDQLQSAPATFPLDELLRVVRKVLGL